MGVRTRTLVTVILVGAVIGIFVLSATNTQLFKGQITDTEGDTTDTGATDGLLPDLSARLEVIQPEEVDGDIIVDVTMENVGEGAITGGTPFVYTIYMNETEVFSNSDSYSELAPGDSFNFQYPIPKLIYNYPPSGKIRLVVDNKDDVKESNEDNNEVTVDYNF